MAQIYKIFVTTDDFGRFFTTQELENVEELGPNAHIQVSVVDPGGVNIDGVADVESGTSSSNPARNFSVSQGNACELGNWQLAGGDRLKLYGGIGEARPNLMLELLVTIRPGEATGSAPEGNEEAAS